ADRTWRGSPAAASLTAGAGASTGVELTVAVPDSAAIGPVTVCFIAAQPNGARADTCCSTLDVLPGPVAVLDGRAGTGLRLAGARPNPARGTFSVSLALPRAAPATLQVPALRGPPRPP